jgi:hypothetical protein
MYKSIYLYKQTKSEIPTIVFLLETTLMFNFPNRQMMKLLQVAPGAPLSSTLNKTNKT